MAVQSAAAAHRIDVGLTFHLGKDFVHCIKVGRVLDHIHKAELLCNVRTVAVVDIGRLLAGNRQAIDRIADLKCFDIITHYRFHIRAIGVNQTGDVHGLTGRGDGSEGGAGDRAHTGKIDLLTAGDCKRQLGGIFAHVETMQVNRNTVALRRDLVDRSLDILNVLQGVGEHQVHADLFVFKLWLLILVGLRCFGGIVARIGGAGRCVVFRRRVVLCRRVLSFIRRGRAGAAGSQKQQAHGCDQKQCKKFFHLDFLLCYIWALPRFCLYYIWRKYFAHGDSNEKYGESCTPAPGRLVNILLSPCQTSRRSKARCAR